MKCMTLSAVVVLLLTTTAAFAQDGRGWDGDQRERWQERGDEGGWSPEDRRPRINGRDNRSYVDDPNDRGELWRRHYSRDYTYADDPSATECHNKVDPVGTAAGAVLGGILGNAAGHGSGGATVVGVIAGGAIGAALTQKMECDDRSYAYSTYSRGFNAGRKNADYTWENPRNKHRGRLHVIDYYNDEDGFRCSVYSHRIQVDGRREEARGRACQQPDGSWAIID